MRYQPGGMDLATVFSMALEVTGPHRLLFGSDSSWFPRGWVKQILNEQLEALQRIGASEATIRAVLGGNLKKLFGSG
jgi:predicted TIM-barrel fold metal-dependent hydrolase